MNEYLTLEPPPSIPVSGTQSGRRRIWVAGLFFAIGLLLTNCGQKDGPDLQATLEEAEALLAEGKLQEGISVLESWDAHHPSPAEILEPLAFAYAAVGDPALAALTFLRLAETSSDQENYVLLAAESLREAGDHSGAVELYRDYLESRPQDDAIWLLLAEQERALGRRTEAIEALMRAAELELSSHTAYLLGSLLEEEERDGQARSWFLKGAELRGEWAGECLVSLMRLAMADNAPDQAWSYMKELEQRFPGHLETSSAHELRGQLIAWQEQMAEVSAARPASTDTVPAASPGPTDPTAQVEDPAPRQASEPDPPPSPEPGHIESTDLDIVIPDQAVAEHPDEAFSFPNEFGLLVPAYDESSTIAPVFDESVRPPEPGLGPESWSELQSESIPAEEAEEAEIRPEAEPEGGTETPAPSPPSPQELFARARAAHNLGAWEDAERLYKAFLFQQPAESEVWYLLSEVQLEQERLPWALASASEAMRRDPSDPRYALQFLRAARRSYNPDRYAQELQRHYNRFPSNPEIILLMAEMEERLKKNPSGAIRYYQEFLARAPLDHPRRASVEEAMRPE